MKIEIKKTLLEGHTPEVIVEAVHANHPRLNKRLLKDPTTSYADGKAIENNRKDLAKGIIKQRGFRDFNRNINDNTFANTSDNLARNISQRGNYGLPKEMESFTQDEFNKIITNIPRIVSSAKR